MTAKKWSLTVLIGTFVILGLLAGLTVIIDPFLHYHGPISGLEYPLMDERYQNDGMARHYKYDALITGTSMTQNFKCSEFDSLWGANSLKTSYAGASFHELGKRINRAFEYNPEIKYVLCSMDSNMINYPANADNYEGYPEYLYDDNPFNDVKYLFNKEVIPYTLAVINYTRAGEKTPTRDEYGSWSKYHTFGRDVVMADLTFATIVDEVPVLTEENIANIYENISSNYVEMALAHKDAEFYFFIPPYSICNWDALVRTKQIEIQVQIQELAVKILLEAKADNIHVYDFSDRIDIIANLDNYSDTLHYGEWINSEILSSIAEGKNELTLENYQQYYEDIYNLYTTFDYSSY